MSKYASKVVAQAQAWLGCKESNGTHKAIIDVYNGHKPLARGYKVKYTDEWCATFVSAVSIKLGYTDIIPTECGCPQMVELFKKLGCWEENEAKTPKSGWIIFYDWEDDNKGDNQGRPNHVGIVEKISGSTITVIEGNKNEAVERRNIAVNGKYIRGYGVPKYDAEEVKTEAVKTEEVKATYTVKKGDTLWKIAQAQLGNGSRYTEIKTLNGLKTNTIHVGQVLKMPSNSNSQTASNSIKVGCSVKLKNGAKTYDGKNLAKFVYNRTYKVKEIKGDRAVITYLGIVVCAVKVTDLTIA